jgi:ribonuclease D
MAEPQENLIDKRPDLLALVEHLRASGGFAFDTEFVSEDTFEPVLCLVQVATNDRLAVIDPFKVGDMLPFWDLVNDPTIEVVMHAAGEDLRIGKIQSGRLPERVLDVQVAAGLVGFGYPSSLGNLVSQILGITLAGGETRTDWRRRPLSDAQLRYALDDVRHLLDLADRLDQRIIKLGRAEWAEEEYRDLIRRIESRDDEDRWRRLPGLQHLNRRGLEVARRLSDWRRENARRGDRPLRQVLRDDLLVAIAKRQPNNRRDLEALRDYNRPHLLRVSTEILAVIADAQTVLPEDLPESFGRHEEGPGLAMVINLLSATLTRCSAQARVAASLVGSQADLKELVRWYLGEAPEEPRPDLARGWRGDVCGEALLDVLAGRRSLRIVDPTAPVPVALDEARAEDPERTQLFSSGEPDP